MRIEDVIKGMNEEIESATKALEILEETRSLTAFAESIEDVENAIAYLESNKSHLDFQVYLYMNTMLENTVLPYYIEKEREWDAEG